MARFDNSFALLGDEEGDDDVTVLVERISKKVDVISTQSKQEKSTQSGQPENSRDQRGRGHGSERGEYQRNGHFQNGYRRNYSQDSYGNGEVNTFTDGYQGHGHGRGRGARGGGRGRGRGRGFGGEHSEAHAGNWHRADRNGSRYSSGDRKGRVNQEQNDNVVVEEPNGKGDLTGDHNKFGDEQMRYRNGNRSYGGGERRGFGGNRGRGRREYRRTDNGGQVKTSDNVDNAEKINGGFEGSAETEEKNNSVYGNGEVAERTQGEKSRKLTEEEERIRKEREERRQRLEEERKQDALLMTLDQYEKMLSEKRKALESQKAEERKVTVDKELEGMQLAKNKKQDDSIIKPKSEEKLKKKDTMEKEKAHKLPVEDIARFLKPASYRNGRRGEFRGSDEDSFRGRYSYRGNQSGSDGRSENRRDGYGGGNTSRGGRTTSNTATNTSCGGADEVGSRGSHSDHAGRTNGDVVINNKDFPVLAAKASAAPSKPVES